MNGPSNALLGMISRGYDPAQRESELMNLQTQKNVLSQAPEERRWTEETRGFERETRDFERQKRLQELSTRPFKSLIEARKTLEDNANFITYDNLDKTREWFVRHDLTGILEKALPNKEYFDRKAPAGMTGEQYFEQWKSENLKTLEQEELEYRQDTKGEWTAFPKKVKKGGIPVARPTGVEGKIEEKGQSDIGKMAYDIYGKPYRQLNPEEKKDIDERVKAKKTEKTPPSAGNVVDLAIKRKFGTEYLSDPEKVKEGDKWLASEEGRKAVKQARDDLTTPSITYLQTGEGFVPAVTKGEGIGTVGKPTGLGKPIPAEETAKMGGLQALLNDVSTARELYKPGWVGPISGRVGAVQEKYTGGAGTNQVKFYAYIRDMKDALLRARSGAQINEQEYKRLVNFLPDENLPSKTFEARLDRFESELNNVLSSKKKAFSEGGYGKRETKPEIQKTDSLGIR